MYAAKEPSVKLGPRGLQDPCCTTENSIGGCRLPSGDHHPCCFAGNWGQNPQYNTRVGKCDQILLWFHSLCVNQRAFFLFKVQQKDTRSLI